MLLINHLFASSCINALSMKNLLRIKIKIMVGHQKLSPKLFPQKSLINFAKESEISL